MTDLLERYHNVRALSERLCEPLATEDYVVQPRAEVSPPKWHLAHTTWFFETFLLQPFSPGDTLFDPHYPRLFNSYYKSQGDHWLQSERGQLSRPTVAQIYQYRQHVDNRVHQALPNLPGEALQVLETGLHHEQQHQELLLMDIKAILAANPSLPGYLPSPATTLSAPPLSFIPLEGGVIRFGRQPEAGFSFCNETPEHPRLLDDFALANRPVTNGEYREFIEDGGYSNPLLWKSDGWTWQQTQAVQAPLYWHRDEDGWREYTLHGDQPLTPASPVSHLSWYEADAFACWAGARLPTEFELEHVYLQTPDAGRGFLQPTQLVPGFTAREGSGFYGLRGNLWEWSASPYVAYPKYQRPAGAFGEYNQKFMANQMVLRGGCLATSRNHFRNTYRNFFYPQQRWAFTGLRLARDV